MTERHQHETNDAPQDAATDGADNTTEAKSDLKGKSKRLLHDLDDVVGEVNKVVRDAVGRGSTAAAALGENVKHTIKDTVQGEKRPRSSVVMVRVDKDSLERLDELVEAGLCGSRSEAAHYLIGEGVKAKQATFDAISQKIAEIRKAKQELRDLLRENEDTPQNL